MHGETSSSIFWVSFGLYHPMPNIIDVDLGFGWIYRWVRPSGEPAIVPALPNGGKRHLGKRLRVISPALTPMRDVPNLFRRQPGIASPGHPLLKRLHGWFHASWLNFRVGTAGILTMWGLTLFPCVLWMIAWYTGWHISFTKLYEESATGISLGFSGLLLFYSNDGVHAFGPGASRVYGRLAELF